MPPTRFNPSSIKNRIKREDVHRAQKKIKAQEKLKRRLALAEAERKDPEAKKVGFTWIHFDTIFLVE
jgi:ribosome production factor 1